MKNISDKTRSLLEKLRQLAERGDGGEKLNAERMLSDHLKRLGITPEELEGVDREEREIKCTAEQYDIGFVHQIIAHVLGDVPTYTGYRGPRKIKTAVYVVCAYHEFIEIEAKLDFYWRHYLNERKIFYASFIRANGLYQKDGITRLNELTPEQRARIEREEQLAAAQEAAQFHKLLNQGKL